jgi:poly(3-hydroxybutyrate) depolymerase
MMKGEQPWGPFAAFLWPALAWAAAGEISWRIARELTGLADAASDPEKVDLEWATPHGVALELDSVQLRDFSTHTSGQATLICAPYALHRATIVDFAPGHSLVEALRGAGLTPLFVADWRSATPAMRDFSIDTYLADLNVLVDHLGAPTSLIGLCQGGWLALMYAARFPRKVRKLVLAGAPIDMAAGESFLSQAVIKTPQALFQELVVLGEGRLLGKRRVDLWCPGMPDADGLDDILQLPETTDPQASARLRTRFDAWYCAVLDLPGRYYLQAVEQLFRANELATGQFVALGQTLALSAVRTPIYLLVAQRDELVAPAQALAVERLVGTPRKHLTKSVLPCRHLSLFMGHDVLAHTWPRVAAWLTHEAKRDALPARSAARDTEPHGEEHAA